MINRDTRDRRRRTRGCAMGGRSLRAHYGLGGAASEEQEISHTTTEPPTAVPQPAREPFTPQVHPQQGIAGQAANAPSVGSPVGTQGHTPWEGRAARWTSSIARDVCRNNTGLVEERAAGLLPPDISLHLTVHRSSSFCRRACMHPSLSTIVKHLGTSPLRPASVRLLQPLPLSTSMHA
jgi:hypothetical protein